MADCSSGVLDWVKALAPVGSWLLVILGWWVVRLDHNRREQRKEIRALIDAVLVGLDILEEQAVRYYTTTDGQNSGALGASIRTGLRRVAMECKHITDATEKRIDCTEPLVAVRQAITAEPFDSINRAPLLEESERLDEIRNRVLDMRSFLQTGFLRLPR